MTIDEAIENLKEDYEIDMYIRDIAPQLAEWLEELKAFRESISIKCDGLNKALDRGKKIGYNKAIDDFVNSVKERFPTDKNGIIHIEEIAEQIKAGGVNE